MSAPTWAKALGLGALAASALGIAIVATRDDDEEGGAIPPDEIEGEDDLDEDDDTIPVETVPGVIRK